MSTLENRNNTALLVVDTQKGVLGASINSAEVVSHINELVTWNRAAGNPVVWVQHSNEEMEIGSESWEIVDELIPNPEEQIVRKIYGDSFEGTNLEDLLEKAGVGHLYVTGAQSDACIRSTIHGAFTRGYDVTLVSDAHTTEDLSEWGAPAPEQVISHTNLYWSFQGAPGRKADVLATEEILNGGTK